LAASDDKHAATRRYVDEAIKTVGRASNASAAKLQLELEALTLNVDSVVAKGQDTAQHTHMQIEMVSKSINRKVSILV
jgi:hypothetical protein